MARELENAAVADLRCRPSVSIEAIEHALGWWRELQVLRKQRRVLKMGPDGTISSLFADHIDTVNL